MCYVLKRQCEGGEQIVEKHHRQKTSEIHPGRYRQYPGGHRHHVRAVQSGRLLLLGIVSGELRYRKHTQLCAQQEVYIPASGSDRSERIAIHWKHSGVLSAGIWDR